MRVYNFGAGPAAIPEPVLRDLQTALWDWEGTGAGIAEINHRSDAVLSMLAQTEQLLRDALTIPDNYQIILTPIPARAHFGLLAMNLAKPQALAQYIDSGHWAQLAMKEAKKYCQVSIAATASATDYRCYPARATWQVDNQAAYLHITDNETIEGLACHERLTGTEVPIVADMTSSLLTRPLSINDYGMIYASAQKNLGMAGLCVIIIRDDLLTRVDETKLPSACHYATLAKQHSLNHTPPVFACYALNRTLHWLKAEGGVDVMVARLHEKAKLIYDLFDKCPQFYRNSIAPTSRSLLNIVCDLPSAVLTQEFLKATDDQGMIGLKGHGSRGGLRISLYNAVSVEATQRLAAFMQDFALRNG